MSMEIKQYPLVTISKKHDSDVVYITFKENLIVNAENVKELIDNRLDFTKNQDHFLVVDLTNIKQITTEAKKYISTTESSLKNILGSALIVSNPLSKLIATVLMKTYTKLPSHLFTKKESALIWINELKSKKGI